MFYHAYDSYMLHAFPKDELLPLSCNGSETLGSYSLTLVDSLDALLILGNHSEFEKAITWVGDNLDFDLDANVSVFETNIRVLGGLLSAHLLAADAPELFPDYDGRLLELAVDLASRLLPAFQTNTRIPYGTVNLRHGVPEGETTVASLAGAGTLILEFGLLSRITGNPAFEDAAHAALVGLWERRSPIGLYGGHIDTRDGTWTDASSGIGAGADSFFEYLLKGAILFDEADYYAMFEEAYEAILAYVLHDGWYFVVEMNSGKMVLPYFDALSAFWPGLQVLLGDVSGAIESVTGFAKVWAFFGFTPEKANLINGALLQGQKSYPLRPELVESLYYLHQATGDPIWLHFGKGILSALQNRTRVACGYAGVVDVETGELEDHMNSFFLAETLKYLYLLFDDGSNFVHSGARGRRYVFNTEGHVLPVRGQFFAPANRSLGVINGHRHCQRPHFMQSVAVPWLNLASSSGLPAARPPAPEAAAATETDTETAELSTAANQTQAEAVVEASGGQSAAPEPAAGATTTPVLTGAQMLGQLMEQSKQQRLRVEQQMAEMRGLIDQLEAKLKLEADLDAAAAATTTAGEATPSAPAPDTAPASPRAEDFKRSQEFQRMKDIARMIEQRREKQQQQKLLQEQPKRDEPLDTLTAATATATAATSAVPHSRVQVVEVRLPTTQHHHQQPSGGQPWVAEDGSPLINRVKSCDPSPAPETATIATKPTTADQTTDDDGADVNTDDVTGAIKADEAPREVVFQLMSDGRLVAVGQHAAALDPETMAHLLHYAQAQLQGGLNQGPGPGRLGRWLAKEQQPPEHKHDQTTNKYDEAVAREAVVSPVR